MKKVVSLLALMALVSGCETMTHTQPLGADSYLVESYYEPQKQGELGETLAAMDQRAFDTCKGGYSKVKEWQAPDLYWGDFVMLWEIRCEQRVAELY